MPGIPFPGVAPLRGASRALLALIVALVVLPGAVPAGVRTRPLPELSGGVEASLVERARAVASEASRVHAIVRVARGERAAAERSGLRLLRSIDGDLWLASLPADAVARGEAPVPAWDLRPSDRCAPGALEALAAARGPVTVRLKAFADSDPGPLRAAVESAGGRVLSVAPKLGLLDAEVPATAVRGLAGLDALRWLEPISTTYEFTNNGMRVEADVNDAQISGLAGSGVVFGQWDSGLADTAHPDLVGRVTAGEPGMMVVPHATHVAGTAIGDGTNSINEGGGGLQWRGVATGATLFGWGVEDHLAEVDTAITRDGIDLSTNSWVYPVNSTNCDLYGDYASSAPEFDQIVNGVYGKRIPVVFAAGNERDDTDCGIDTTGGYGCIPPPGTAKNVITVGAHFSDAGHMTPFSSWGPTDDGRLKPDVSAPGCQITGDFGIKSAQVGGLYSVMCGTSMATPCVSGAVAMILEEWWARFLGTPRPATSKALLAGHADDRAAAGPDYRFGFGAVMVNRTIEALRTATTVEGEVDDAGADVRTFRIPSGQAELKITLAWDDPAGAELADTTLVNDLDLELSPPSGGTLFPFVLDPADPDAPAGTGVNRLDNVEQVVVASPEPGIWTVRVLGTNVPQGPQSYSLVGYDSRPPADPALFAAVVVDDTTAELSWIRPGDSDRDGTLVVRSSAPIAWEPDPAGSYPVGSEPSPGVFVVANDDVDHSVVPLVDDGLAPSTTFHWKAFSRDEVPNWSPGVEVEATTTGDAVDAPVPSRGPSLVRFARTGANPFRHQTGFRFELPATARVELVIVDATGRRVATLLRGERQAGSHLAAWDGRDDAGRRAAAGVYFARFRAGSTVLSEKLLLLR